MEHANRKHALLSASGSERWLNCTPSAVLEDKEERIDNDYTHEGTLAHEFADISLHYHSGKISKSEYIRLYRKNKKNKYYNAEMDVHVDKYVQFVLERYNLAKRDGYAVLEIESRVDYSDYAPEGFGTGDARVVSDEILDVIDLKFGAGVKVFAEKNTQLMLYALGSITATDLQFDYQTIRLTIVQPRLDHVSTWDISKEDLIEWGEKVVKPTAKKAYAGKGQQKAGKWCRWCKVKHKCKALEKLSLEAAQAQFTDPYLMTDAEILNVYSKLELISDHINAVKEYVYDKAKHGKKWEGYKLVRGMSKRRWKDEQEVKRVLREQDFKPEQYLNVKLKGIGDVSDLMGVDRFKNELGKLIVKPEGAPKLVPVTDSRKGIGLEQAKIDFNNTDKN